MIYKEIRADIFEQDRNDTYFAHCIGADALMGRGIAIDMRAEFGLVDLTFEADRKPFEVGSCVEYNNVLNLVTKKSSYGKPTYITMHDALTSMKHNVIRKNIKKVYMPRIGSGLDRLDWSEVSRMIKEIFNDVDIEIIVCYI